MAVGLRLLAEFNRSRCRVFGQARAAHSQSGQNEDRKPRAPGPRGRSSSARPLWAVLATVILAVPAAAQQPGAYCEAGSDALARFTLARRNPTTVPDESLVYNNCSPGDTIIIAGGHLGLIARVCDFSRSVVATPGGNVLCVISPQRPVRSNRK